MLIGPLLGALGLWLAGCATVGWYGQAARGQIELLAKREDIAEMIADPATPADLRERLQTVLDVRRFAVESLDLPDSRSYTLYADLGRDAPLWNVVATPRFSMAPKTWCYPFVGCLSYRGYFRRERAQAAADRLAEAGFDAAVFPASAYSTLGWFADPVLESMLDAGDLYLAELIFHELTHEKRYVRGDTAFNEAYATFVAREGVRRWLAAHGTEPDRARWERQQALERAFTALLLDAREQLIDLYGRDLKVADMAVEKAVVFKRLRLRYRDFVERHGTHRFDGWFSRRLNNAHLAMVATYESGVAAFAELLAACDGNLACLHERADRLAADSPEARAQFLAGNH